MAHGKAEKQPFQMHPSLHQHLFWMKSWRILFIIIWNIVGELHSPKNMTVGSNSPWLVWNTAFHSSPSLICTLLNPHQRSSTVKNSVLMRGGGQKFLTMITLNFRWSCM